MKIGLVLLGGKLSSVLPLVRIVHVQTKHLFNEQYFSDKLNEYQP